MSDFWKDYEPEPSKTAPVQEPVAWAMYQRGRLQSFWLDKGDAYDFEFTSEHEWKPLYTTPPAAPVPMPADWFAGMPDEYRKEALRIATQPAAQPAVQEPIGYLFQHEETGLTTVVDVQQVEWGFEKNNPRHQKIGPVYTTPPAQPAVPDAIHHTDLSEHPQYIEGWNDCRAEMLKGMKP
jgi:hypothetical protein